MLRTLLGGLASSTAGSWRVRRVVWDEKRAEPVSLDRFSHGHAWRLMLEMVVFVVQSLSRHGIEVVWRSSRGDGSSSLVFSTTFFADCQEEFY